MNILSPNDITTIPFGSKSKSDFVREPDPLVSGCIPLGSSEYLLKLKKNGHTHLLGPQYCNKKTKNPEDIQLLVTGKKKMGEIMYKAVIREVGEELGIVPFKENIIGKKYEYTFYHLDIEDAKIVEHDTPPVIGRDDKKSRLAVFITGTFENLTKMCLKISHRISANDNPAYMSIIPINDAILWAVYREKIKVPYNKFITFKASKIIPYKLGRQYADFGKKACGEYYSTKTGE